MNKTINANIGGFVFQVDEDAYQRLHNYLETLKRHFSQSEGKEEIIEDIESRIAEILVEKLQNRKIVNINDVDAVIKAMGKPEDFDDIEEKQAGTSYTSSGDKRFFRNPDDKVLGGVCSGISSYFNIDPLWLRLAFALSVLMLGTGILIYIILWIIIPEAKTAAEKLQMKGEKVNISNIEKTIKEEFEQVKNKFNDFAENAKGYAKGEEVREFKSRSQKFFYELGGLIRNIFQYIGKALGVFIVVVGIIILIGLGLGAVGATSAMTVSYPVFMDYIFENSKQATLGAIGLVLLIAIPLIALITKGLLFLMKVKVKSPWLRISLVSAWFVGLVITIFVCWQVSTDFRTKGSFVETTVIQVPGDTLWLEMSNNDFIEFEEFDFDHIHFDEVKIYDDTIILTDIQLHVDLADVKDVEMRMYFSARGNTRHEANQRAKKIKYDYLSDSTSITFSPAFSMGDHVWRNQKVRIYLKIPKNKTVQMSNDLDRILYNEEFVPSGTHITLTSSAIKQNETEPISQIVY